MSPGIGLMKRRLEKEKDAIALAVSGIAKKYNVQPKIIKTLDVFTEPYYLQLKEGEEIQIVRFGYCRKDSQNQAIFTHK